MTVDELKAMDADGSATPVDDTNNYAATLNAITAFSSTDLPSDAEVEALLVTPVAYVP